MICSWQKQDIAPKYPDWHWNPPSSLFNGRWGLLPHWWRGQGKNLTIPSNTPSWHAQRQFYLHSIGHSIFLRHVDNGTTWQPVSKIQPVMQTCKFVSHSLTHSHSHTQKHKLLKTLSEFFIYQLMHKRVPLKNIKIYIKTAPTRFGWITVIRERIIWVC
jgi:hypothetical protein